MNSKHGVGLTTRREMLQGLAMVGGGGLLSRLVPDVAYAATQDFNAMQPGSLPPGWVPVTAGGYEGGIRLPGVWERDLYGERAKELEITPSADFRIVADPTAPSGGPVLEIVNPGTDAWCVKTDVSIRDGYVEVQGKNTPQPQHIFGKSNKGPTFGVVWRYQNPKNFYCVMWDQSDLKMAKMEEGGFEVFEVSPMTRIPGDQWHTVRVEFTGHKFTALLNGEVLYTG
jgi:hypothetical protein